MRARLKTTVASIALAFSSGVVQANTLTFDGLGYVQPFTGYSEGGYTFDLVLGSDNGGGQIPHIGDGTNNSSTLNWHDDGANGLGAYISMTKIGGGAFNLVGFDYFEWASMSVEAIGYGPDSFGPLGGTATVNYNGVTEVIFRASAAGGQIDNVNVTNVTAVPEPETYAMLLAGLGLLGFAARRRKQKEAALT